MANESLPKELTRSKRAYKFSFKPLHSELMTPEEDWRIDETGFYSFSNKGRAFSHKRGCLVGSKKENWYRSMSGFTREDKNRLIHREVYRLFVGEIPEGYEINHKDGDKTNNAIENLEVVTKSENMQHCYRVLKRSTRNKLTQAQVNDLRRRYQAGEVLRRLAEEFGINRGTASRIVRGVTWKESSKGPHGSAELRFPIQEMFAG